MTAVSDRPTMSTSLAESTLPGALSEQLAEAIASYPDPHTRAVAIAGLVVEVFETVRWLHGSSPDEEELTSLYRLVAVSYAHRSRMAARPATGARR
jgi:hypothetical protein